MLRFKWPSVEQSSELERRNVLEFFIQFTCCLIELLWLVFLCPDTTKVMLICKKLHKISVYTAALETA